MPARNVRKRDPEHVARAVRQIGEFGLVLPLLVRGNEVIDGVVRLDAAKQLGLTKVGCIDISHIGEARARMLRISLNRLAETGQWDIPELKFELEELRIEDLDLSLSMFTPQELDIICLDDTEEASDAEELTEPPLSAVSRPGDLWLFGDRHRLLCGDSLEAASYERLLGGGLAQAVLTDAPYNVKILGNVSGLGKTKHGEFKMASGEMTADEFGGFLTTVHKHCHDHLANGAVAYSFMDWRSIDVLMAAGREAGFKVINLVVWNKGSGAMGGFLRSAHELVAVFCKGDKPKTNNVALGKHGRDRTNVWDYPGANRADKSTAQALKNHPTPKNLQMCIDALLDITHAGDIVLDPFLGSGTTLIAAEKSKRKCYAIELDATYVDWCIERFVQATGEEPILDETGQSFSEVAAARAENED